MAAILIGLFFTLIATVGIIMVSAGLKRAKDNPPEFGLVVNNITGFTKRTVKPGSTILIMPFLERVIFTDATIEDVDVPVNAVSQDNIDMVAEVKISYKPDYERANNYIDGYFLSGGRKKINERLAALTKSIIRGYINEHTAKKCEKSPIQASDVLIKKLTNLPEDEAKAKIQKENDGIPDIEGMGTIITRISVPFVRIANPEIQNAREATTKEKLLRRARVERAKTFNKTVEERNNALKDLAPAEKQKREQEYREERDWDLVESGHGEVIRTTQPQGTNVIVDGRSKKK